MFHLGFGDATNRRLYRNHLQEVSLFAFPARASNEDFQALHPFVVGRHRVLFGGVHCGLRLLNGWRLVLSVIPLLASRQQQDGHGRHCCCGNKPLIVNLANRPSK